MRRCGAGIAFTQRQVHALSRDRFAARDVEELVDHVFRRRRCRTDDAEIAPTAADLHVQPVFQQPQVLVQRTTQVREAHIVRGLEIEFARSGIG